MKYVIWILLIGGGYYYYQKSQILSDEGLVQAMVEQKDKFCASDPMLAHYKVTRTQCSNNFALSLIPCANKIDKNYPGSKYDSLKQFEAAGGEIMECINARLALL